MITPSFNSVDEKNVFDVRLRLFQFAVTHPLHEVLQNTLDELEDLTGSAISFFHFVESDQKTLSLQAWSTRTLEKFCKTENAHMHYGIDQAGVWVDCVRQREPVIHNDYNSLPHRKGLPSGHATVIRELVVPIIKEEQIVAILGIGNKPSDYTQRDMDIVSFLADVTWNIISQKILESSLIAEKERFRLIFESNPASVAITKLCDNRIINVNKAWEETTGYNLQEAVGRTPFELNLWVNPQDRQKMVEHFSEQGITQLEVKIRRKDGSLRDLLMSVEKITIQGEFHLLSMAQDITERKSVEAKHERLLTAINQAGESIVITDVQGIILYVNPAFESVSGYSSREAIGQNPRFLKSGKHNALFYRDLWQAIQSGHLWTGRIINKHKDGHLYTESVTISPVRDPSGAIVNYVAVKRDITEHLLLESQYQQAQKMESIGRLAGGVAHDFNNLLSIINGLSDMILRDLPPKHPLRQDLEQILDAGNRAASVTSQLLAFSRKQILQLKTINLNEVVQSMSMLIRRLIGEDIQLTLTTIPDLGLIHADLNQIQQIILNLAVNARDAMPNGGTLRIETKNSVFDETFINKHPEAQHGSYAMLSISDTGIGMDSETQKHIFEPFFTTKGEGKGTGLGLATVYGIVKQSKGFIWTFSEPGNGSVFELYFPRKEEIAPYALETTFLPSNNKGTETILVVEDEVSVRKIICRILREKGYKVFEAAEGVEAQEISENYAAAIDLVISDVIMPHMNGKDLVAKLHDGRPALKALLISGYTDNETVLRDIMNAKIPFLHKPFLPEDLLGKVRSILDP